MNKINEFQRFEKLIKIAFEKYADCFTFEDTTMRPATPEDVETSGQAIFDYSIDGLMDLKVDDQIVEKIGDLIKIELAPNYQEYFKKIKTKETLQFTKEYNKAMILAKKNSLDENAITEFKNKNNVFYVMPYEQKFKDVKEQKITKTEFRFVTIVINNQ